MQTSIKYFLLTSYLLLPYYLLLITSNMVGVAQLVRASGCGPEGRGFESHYSPQRKKHRNSSAFFNEIRLTASEIASL